MDGTSGAILDHEEAEAERAEAERAAEDEALTAAGVGETPEPDPEPELPAGEPGDGDNPSGQEAALDELALVVDGDGQISFSVGGKRPTGASIKIVGGKIDLPGSEFKKGEDIALRLVVRVTEVAFVDELDQKTRQVVGCERRHKARPISVGLLSE